MKLQILKLIRWPLVSISIIVLTGVSFQRQAIAQSVSNAEADTTASLLSELIRVNTSNPPGHEGSIAELLEPRFKALGFEVDTIPTPEPGKAHFIARLRGDQSKRPVLLAAHADVVGVEREKWTLDPFGGVIKDGYVFGRGAIDFKGGMAVFARAVMMLAERKIPLARDVIFLAEADEEGGSYNTSWLAQNYWSKIECEFSLNEGGWIIKGQDGRVRYVSISTADKTSIAIIVTARGTSTHSSMPRPDNAIFTLGQALAKLADYETEVKLDSQYTPVLPHFGQDEQPTDVRVLSQLNERRPQACPAGGPGDQQRSVAACDYAKYYCPGTDKCRIPRKRDTGLRRGNNQRPDYPGYRSDRNRSRDPTRHRQSAN